MSEPISYVCQGCVTGQGYLWPIASDSKTDHDYVERCDSCNRFETDYHAWLWLMDRLRAEGYTFLAGTAPINHFPQPFIDRVRHAR